MILMDSKGDKIHVLVRKDEFNQWSQCLLENNTYVMHNFNVMRNDLQYKACDHLYRMQFTPGTTLKQREFPNISELEYDFKNFSDILSGNFRSDLLIASVKSINEISSLTSTEEITCVTVGTTTMFVVGRQGWYYDGCTKCTKKADVKDGPFTCKCGHFNQNSTPRKCADIIGIPASEVKNQMLAEGEDDPKTFPLVLDELLARTMVLRVKVQPSYNPSSVIRLSEDPNLIKKVLSQIGVFEVFFKTLFLLLN
ncbi:hypothetical protein Lal_00024295 [Lupinus albus]|nr:hypothetical protein Lal_00024295 [Lupinus albus]